MRVFHSHFFKYCFAGAIILVCNFCNCYTQVADTSACNQIILLKVSFAESSYLVTALCKNRVEAFNKIAKQYQCLSVKRASLLQDDGQMSRWVEMCFKTLNDSSGLITALKKLPFVDCVQNRPGELVPCSKLQPSTTLYDSLNNSLPRFLAQTHLPYLWSIPKKRNIIVAVVDDGVRLTHKDVAGRIYTNPGEIPNNNKDDDGNGFIDDLHGWDISDNDNDVSPPGGRLQDFYHGTHIAGQIAISTPVMTGDKFGIYILPVKCLSDNASFTYLTDGYKGIEYAIKMGANVINCSWGGGAFSQYEKDLMQAAYDKNILIVASAGNYPTEHEQYPAGSKNVIAVTGVDSNNIKPHDFNYGNFISLTAPGTDIEGSNVMDDSSRTLLSGTSDAAPVVTAIASLLMACYPELTAKDVEILLKNSATPLDEINAEYAGKLGAGLVNAFEAVHQLNHDGVIKDADTITNAKGYLMLRTTGNNNSKQHTWFIHPYGRYPGIRLHLPPSYTNSRGNIILYKKSVADTNILANYSLQQLPDSAFAAEDSLWVVIRATRLQKDFALTIPYSVQTIDSSCLYCSSTKIFTAPEGMFGDGSKENDYAEREDCKWLIEAPPGKKIALEFTEFDTEPKVDFVYVFDGGETNQRILAIYSGPNLPPPVLSTGNKLLVWFVTNETIHGKGWQARYNIK